MKKKFLFLALLLVISMIASVSVGAASDKILIGTPTVDGVVDEIYKQSLTLETGRGKNAYETPWLETTVGKILFLYDDSYVYICAEITDEDLLTIGEENIIGVDNPWANDNCEFRLSLDGGTTTIKVGIDAYGYRCYGLASNMEIVDYSTIRYATSKTEKSYVIEVAIPVTDNEVLDIYSHGKLGFKLQLNDRLSDGTQNNFAFDYAGEGPKGLVFYELSDDAVVIEEVVLVSEAEAATVATAPQTADILTVLLLAVAISGASVVATKKK